jgi:redox-sensitive bicupin YhaK (pirin superfamily)
MGNSSIITTGEIQVMSAGTGIYHSEFNADPQVPVKLLQIWIFPNKKNVEPRYDQIKIDNLAKRNTLKQILSPNKDDDGVWIYQNAWFHQGTFDNNFEISYKLKNSGNGVYAFVIKGDFLINGHNLNERDGIGLTKIENISLKHSPDAEIFDEVPLHRVKK